MTLNLRAAPTPPNRLTAERERKGWTYEELGSKIGCSGSTIRRAERGDNITLGLALKIAAALGCKIDYLWAGELL
jgi:transcriptional regulator with XRE-family HTH domain